MMKNRRNLFSTQFVPRSWKRYAQVASMAGEWILNPLNQKKKPEEAEKDLGSIIFSLIDGFSDNPVNIRDYRSLNEKDKLDYISELEKEVETDSAEAMYFLSIEYFGLARNERSMEYLERSEELLTLSSNLGYEDACLRLTEHWDLIKNAALKFINGSNDINK